MGDAIFGERAIRLNGFPVVIVDVWVTLFMRAASHLPTLASVYTPFVDANFKCNDV
jgi:uncharacterized membrane protein